jgi:hypothetical protein
MRSFMISTPHQILFDDKMKDEMGGECSKYGGEEKCI